MMEKLRRFRQSFLGEEEEQEDDYLGESGGSLSLSPLQKLYAFALCFVAGVTFMLLSLIVFARPIKFAVLFSLGNLLAVGSTAFLIGPVQQTRMMLDPVRVYATAVYITTVILALVCAILIHSKVLTLIAMVIEICALIW
ncbi:hypothetical protein KSP39_PZI024356 [Platanthera zijinensis]|uniref:Vesicle transport protein n=1 Tax=Platanthera zijinensis TaxID=2320716 RepID=A0AAP0AU84_9ASPA